MGLGDELIVSGHVKKMYTGTPVMILDKFGRARLPRAKTETSVWLNNPKIATEVDPKYIQYTNAPSFRPYIKSYDGQAKRWTWNTDYSVNDYVGEIFLYDHERCSRTEPFITIEPNYNVRNSPNKNWGIHKFQQVATALSKHIEVVQIYSGGTMLQDVTVVKTETFRQACGYIDKAEFHIGVEGGLHHAAAALDTKAIVIFGGYIGHKITGYENHINFGEEYGCGNFKSCSHCADIMRSIEVDDVVKAANNLLCK